MADNVTRHYTVNLGTELLELNAIISSQEKEIEMLRLKAAKYKAYFFMKNDLADKLEKQIHENLGALTGEFNGFCYASWRANAIFRSLEDMLEDKIITEQEYRECEYV